MQTLYITDRPASSVYLVCFRRLEADSDELMPSPRGMCCAQHFKLQCRSSQLRLSTLSSKFAYWNAKHSQKHHSSEIETTLARTNASIQDQPPYEKTGSFSIDMFTCLIESVLRSISEPLTQGPKNFNSETRKLAPPKSSGQFILTRYARNYHQKRFWKLRDKYIKCRITFQHLQKENFLGLAQWGFKLKSFNPGRVE